MRAFFVRSILVLIVLAASSGVLLPASAQDQRGPESDRALLASPWKGTWVSSKGYLYSASVRLRVAADFSVEGEISWVLERSPREEDKAKLGFGGTEYVRGTYDPRARVLRLEGYRKDDPNIILGLDKYHLVLADSDQVLGGITWNHGDWQGLFSLLRVPNR